MRKLIRTATATQGRTSAGGHPSEFAQRSSCQPTLEHQVIEGVEAGLGLKQTLGTGDGARNEYLPARGTMGQTDLFVRPEEVHLVRAVHGATTQC